MPLYYPRHDPASLLPGPRIGWAGDSVTVGSGASSSSVNFIAQAERVAGSYRLRSTLNAGNAGDTASALFARIPGIISGNTLDHIHVQVGTADAATGTATTWQNYATTMTSIADLIRNNGLSVSFGTVIPQAIANTGPNSLIQQYNLWMEFWCPKRGIPLADLWTALVDPATGGLLAAYDSGDGVHPNDAGHLAMAKACAPIVISRQGAVPWPGASIQALGLVDDPLASATTGWTASGAAATFSHAVAPGGIGELPAGNWRLFNVDNSGGGSSASKIWSYTLSSSKYAASDILGICFYAGHDDISQASSIKLQMANSGTAYGIVLDTNASVNNPGPVFEPSTLPGSPVTITFQFVVTAAARANVTGYLGAFQIFNLTNLGFGAYL